MEKIVKNFRAEIKSVNEDDFTVCAIVSHSKKDRQGDIIPPESMKKRIKRYKEHPVLLLNHDYSVENQIGEATDIKLKDDHVEATFKYYVGKGNAKADWAFELAKAGMAAYSIGFQSFGFDWIEEKDEQGNKCTTGRKFTDIELLEISHVAIPANPSALQLMLDDKDASVEEKEICELVLKGITEGTIKTSEPLVKDMAEEELNKTIAEMQKSISAFQQQITEMSGRLLQLEQKVTMLENVEHGEEVQENAEEEAGNDKHYSAEILKMDDKTKSAGAGASPIPTPDAGQVNVASLVKDAIKNVIKGERK